MKAKRLLWLTFLLPTLIFAVDRPLVVEIDNFDGGVDTAHLSDKQRTSNLSDCLNFLSDRKYGLSRRDGTQRGPGCGLISTKKLGRYLAPSGTEWLIRLDCRGNLTAGGQILASGGCFSVCISTNFQIDLTVDTDFAEGLGKAWFTNKVNGLMSWDENDFVLYANAPKAARIKIYKNRVILGDVSNEQSSIRLSGELNGGDFNNDARLSTSAVSIRVGGVNDGNKVHWIHVGLDELLIGKAFSIYRLTGNDQRDFRLGIVSPEIGSIYPNTIAQKAERTMMLTNRGLDSYTPPYSFEKVGESIRDQLEPLAGLVARGRSNTVDTQAQWGLGTSVPTGNISTTFVAGAIGPPNKQHIDTVASDWSGGVIASSYSVLSTTITAGSLTFLTSAAVQLANPSFETAGTVSTNALTWTIIASTGIPRICDTVAHSLQRINFNAAYGLTPFDGSFTMTQQVEHQIGAGESSSTVVQLLDANDSVLLSQSYTPGTPGTWVKRELDTTSLNGRIGKLRIITKFLANGYANDPFTGEPGGTMNSTMTTTYLIYIGTSVVYRDRSDRLADCVGGVLGEGLMSVDLAQALINHQASANFTSRTFDTLVSSPNYGPFQASVQLGTATFGIQTSSSNDGCCWEAATSVSTQSPAITSTRNRYIRYVSTISVSQTSTNSVTIQINDVTLGSWVTGYFQTSTIDAGQSITSWGLLTADQATNNGTISYQVQSSDDGNFNGPWVSQSLDVSIGVPVKRYIAARAIFSASASTHTPSVNSITFNWNDGESPPDPFGTTYKESYYLFYSTSVSANSVNDRIAVFNRNNAIDTYGGVNGGASTVYSNALVVGDALQTGYVYSMFTSTDGSDFNNNVQSYFKIRRLDGGDPDSLKIFDRIYMTLSRDNVSASQIFKVEYYIDGGTTAYRAENVELSTGTRLGVLKSNLPLDGSALVQGYYIEIKVSELTQYMFPYNVHRIKLYGTIKEPE